MCSDWAVSIRLACGAIGFHRSTFHYKYRRSDQAAVEKRIKEICESRVRYGYRRVHVLLEREGWVTSPEEGLRVTRAWRQLLRGIPFGLVPAGLRARLLNDTNLIDGVHASGSDEF
jgi:putative transposase